MARADDTELIDQFEEFYRSYYRNEIGELAQKYPSEQKSLYIDWQDLYRFDPDLADDFRSKPNQLREYAEEALRLYDLPVDVSLGQAHVRVRGLPETTDIREIRSDHRGMLISVQGIVRKATDVRPKITTAAFECQRCGTLTRIPQEGGEFQEPHECQGCERQGPFRINYDQSEFIDAQKLRVQESPEGLRGGETPQNIDINIEDDITGRVTAGDHVRVSGILKLEQQGNDREKSAMFDVYMEGSSVEIEDEEFEEMDITEADKKEIVELSNEPDIYEQIEGAIAPSIYGYEMEKRAMAFQLFSGVTKHLPDESRTRGDIHVLLIGDPGTGKCIRGDEKITLGDGSRQQIRDIVESRLNDPKQIDDGVYDTTDIPVPSVTEDGEIQERRATKVWKREAPDRMYQVRTEAGNELEMTPSHPLFVPTSSGFTHVRAENLREGELVATAQSPQLRGSDRRAVVAPDGGRSLESDLGWDRIESIEIVEPDYDWVYDLEVEGTHNYISEGIVSHNSALLQYINNIAPRSVFTSGKGASSAGLTAAAVRDDFGEGQQWTLEAGALVLADRGIAAVDELDKMRSEDQSAMHEALEQQSYHPDSEILLSDGHRVNIGEFVDERMADEPDAVVDGVDCEILPVDDVGVHTVDLETNTTEKTDVDRVSRHEAPEEFVRVEFSNGRDIVVTPEHPMFVEEDGTIGTVEARDVTEGTFVPAPRKLPNSAAPVGLADEPHVGKEKDVALPDELSPAFGEILGFLVAEGHSYAGSSHEIGFSNQDERLLDRMDALMTLVFGMESTDTTNEAGTVTKRWVSTKLYRWFETNVPEVMETARDKRIPAAVLGASEEVIRRFLVGAFAGDGGFERRSKARETSSHGGVESESMALSTASEGLARDYADALSKIGVASRIHHDTCEDSWKTYVRGDSMEPFVERVVDSTESNAEAATGAGVTDGLRYYRVTDVETVPNAGEYECEWVYDVTVEPTNTFVSQGVVLHNSISISKAGINATLKSRCSLLGAANPTYGRFDQYEPIGEQIDLDPPLISRFDLIFTVTDQPDEEKDAELAEHILQTNYAGELNTHRTETNTSNYTEDEVAQVTDEVAPTIDPELLRKYVAYAKRNCYPTMTEEAKAAIQEFYVNLRAQGASEDAPVPVTARKLEALVRLAEASARVRLSDTVEEEDARRGIEIAEYCLKDIGMDPETGELDADVVETGTSKSQRDRIKSIKNLIAGIEEEYDEGAPVDVVIERAEEEGMETSKAEHEIEKLKQKGEVYEPKTDHLRTT